MKLFFITMVIFSFFIGQQSELASQCNKKLGHKYNLDYGKCEEVVRE